MVQNNDSSFMKTGDKLEITTDNDIYTYMLSVAGDVLGDGEITKTGIATISSHIIDGNVISGEEYLKAADYNNDENIKMNDIMSMLRKISD